MAITAHGDHAQVLVSNWDLGDESSKFWKNYVEWVRINYKPHLQYATVGELVDMHLADHGLTRETVNYHYRIVKGSQEDLITWILTFS